MTVYNEPGMLGVEQPWIAGELEKKGTHKSPGPFRVLVLDANGETVLDEATDSCRLEALGPPHKAVWYDFQGWMNGRLDALSERPYLELTIKPRGRTG